MKKCSETDLTYILMVNIELTVEKINFHDLNYLCILMLYYFTLKYLEFTFNMFYLERIIIGTVA